MVTLIGLTFGTQGLRHSTDATVSDSSCLRHQTEVHYPYLRHHSSTVVSNCVEVTLGRPREKRSEGVYVLEKSVYVVLRSK